MGAHPAASRLARFLTRPQGFREETGGHTRAMDGRPPGDGLLETQDLMAQEGRRIVDSARGRGLVLRVLGGLAVHEHCAGLRACRRDHLDLDLAGLRRQTGPVVEVFGELGYEERVHVRQATAAGQAQFSTRLRAPRRRRGRVHPDDHVDVFFDRFKLDHVIDLRGRLSLHSYAVTLTDTLATKLQMHAPEPRDVRDAVMLLAASGDAARGAGEVDAAYLAGLCAHDWGLFYDVVRGLQRCREALDGAGLDPRGGERAAALVARLTGAIDAAPKTVAWRLRARVGTRKRWWDLVEEQERAPASADAGPAAGRRAGRAGGRRRSAGGAPGFGAHGERHVFRCARRTAPPPRRTSARACRCAPAAASAASCLLGHHVLRQFQRPAHARRVARAQVVVPDVLDHGVDVVHDVDVEAPVGGAHAGHVVQVQHAGVGLEVHVHVLDERDRRRGRPSRLG